MVTLYTFEDIPYFLLFEIHLAATFWNTEHSGSLYDVLNNISLYILSSLLPGALKYTQSRILK